MPPVPIRAILSGTWSAARRRGLAEGPGPVQRGRGRALAIEVGRDDGQVEAGREEVQGHGDAVVELPLLGIGHIDGGHDLGDDPLRQVPVAGARNRPMPSQSGSSMGPS